MIEINKNPSPRTLRQFSIAGGVFAAIVGYLFMTPGGSLIVPATIWSLGAAVAVLGLIKPPLVLWVYLGMSWLTAPIGIVISLTVLAIVYYIVVTPIGLVMRLLGNDPLGRRREPDAETYWRKRKEPEPNRYFRQF